MNKTSNSSQALWVMAGSVSSFAFAILSSMLLSRYFTKHDYGTYKQVMYVYSSMVAIFVLGLPKAFSYFLPRINEGQAKDLITKINIVLISLGAGMSLFLFIGSRFIAELLKNKDLSAVLQSFALVPLFLLPTMGVEGILATFRQTRFLAFYKTLSSIFTFLCVAVPVVYFKGTVNSAIVGFTISSFLCFLMALYLKFMPIKNAIREVSPYGYKDIFVYTLPILGASFWGILISSADQFFISRYFGSEVFAEFANGSFELPFVSMIIGSASLVLMPVFSKILHESTYPAKQILPLWKSVFEKSVKLIYPLVLFFWVFSDVTMELLYGAGYENSSTYFRLKLFIDLFRMISFGPLIFAMGNTMYYNRVFMYSAFMILALDVLSVFVLNSPYIIVLISVSATIVRILVFIRFIAQSLNVGFLELFPLKLIATIFITSLMLLLPIRYVLINFIGLYNVELLAVAILIFGLTFLVSMRILKIEYIEIIQQMIKRNGK